MSKYSEYNQHEERSRNHLLDSNPPETLYFSNQNNNEKLVNKRRKRLLCLGCWVSFFAILLILLPLIFFLGIPRFGQYLVDGSQMAVGQSIIEKAGARSFILRLEGNVTDAGAFNADISFDEQVILKWEDIELARIPMAPLHYKSSVALIDERLNVTVTNATAFAAFSRYMMTRKSFVWVLEGHVTVVSLGLRIPNLNIKKELKLNGFNQFQDLVRITSFDLPSDDPQEGIRAVVSASVFNPSPVGVIMGPVEFDMIVNGSKIGAARVPSLSILPGNNTLNLEGFLVPITSKQDAKVVSQVFTLFMANKNSIITVKITKIDSDEHAPYIDDALVGFSMSTVFESTEKLHLIKTVTINDMALALDASQPYVPRLSAENIVARFKMPFAFPIEVTKVRQDVVVIASGKKIATIDSGWIDAYGSSYSQKIVMSLNNVPFRVIPGKERDFEDFVMQTSLGRGNVSLLLTGSCDAVAETAIGKVEIDSLQFKSEVSIPCMNGFMHVPPVVQSMNVVGGTSEGIELLIVVELFNPSQMSLMTGDLTFDLYYSGIRFGYAFMRDFKLEPGVNTVSVRAFYSPAPDALSKARRMLSLQSMGRAVTTACVGTSSTTAIASLKPAMEKLKMVMKLPGLPNNMIQSTRFMISSGTLKTGMSEAGMTVFNSFDTPISIISISAVMLTDGSTLGTMHIKFDEPMFVPPHSAKASPPLPLKVQISFISFLASLKGATGSLRIKVISDLEVKINDYYTTLHYEQDDVPSRLESV